MKAVVFKGKGEMLYSSPPARSRPSISSARCSSIPATASGDAFHADGSWRNRMRLNFTNATAEQIDEGIGRLGRVISRAVDRVAHPATASSLPAR